MSARLFFPQLNYVGFRLKANTDLLFKGQSEDWPLSFPPITVNAVYTYSRNQILFPVGILQAPFYSEDQPMALNFGHLGAFIGHEVTELSRVIVIHYGAEMAKKRQKVQLCYGEQNDAGQVWS